MTTNTRKALNLLLTEPQYRQAVRAVKEEGQP